MQKPKLTPKRIHQLLLARRKGAVEILKRWEKMTKPQQEPSPKLR